MYREKLSHGKTNGNYLILGSILHANNFQWLNTYG